MRINILTTFPEMVSPFLNGSILGRAVASRIIEINITDIRPFSESKHKNTDDYPFGGGAGMVMMPQPICDAVDAVDPEHKGRRLYMSPRGVTFDQSMAEELSKEEQVTILCGHYEGVDQRAIDLCQFEEVSVGDYVLTGGELAACIIADASARLVPGVLGSADSPMDESFTSGLLEYPQYTRPRSYRDAEVPDVLLNGDHAKIARWRRDRALELTLARRPDMLKHVTLDKKDMAFLSSICNIEQFE